MRIGPPRGMVPGDALVDYLGLTAAQKAKYAQFRKAVEALGQEGFLMGSFSQLKLTPGQIERLAKGEGVRKVLSAAQIKVLEDNQRPMGPGGPPPGGGFPGGPGFPGGQ